MPFPIAVYLLLSAALPGLWGDEVAGRAAVVAIFDVGYCQWIENELIAIIFDDLRWRT